MMKTVKHTFYTIGDHGSDLARSIGSGTADLVKRIGPRRGLLGLFVVAAAIGGSVVLVRYLRARNQNREELDVTGSELPNGKSTKPRQGSHAQSTMPGTH